MSRRTLSLLEETAQKRNEVPPEVSIPEPQWGLLPKIPPRKTYYHGVIHAQNFDFKPPHRDMSRANDEKMLSGPVGIVLGVLGFIFIFAPVAGAIGWLCGGIAGVGGFILFVLLMMLL